MDVITLGETMVSFEPNGIGPMRYFSNFSAKIAGAESNVAIGLSRLGHKAGWISRLGNDEFGKKIISFIRGEGVDVSQVSFASNAPTGLFFKETLTPDRFKVHYYRENTAASQIEPSDLNRDYIGKFKYLHITGITPALSDNCYKTIIKIIEHAKEFGLVIVFDPNLRRNLWSDDRAKKILLELISKSDIILPGINEGVFLFDEDDPKSLTKYFHEFGASTVVIKLGEQGAYYSNYEESGFAKGFMVKDVIDPIGAGDGFAAGLLSGFLDGQSLRESVIRGNAIGAYVTQFKGDVEGLPDREQLYGFINRENQEDVNR